VTEAIPYFQNRTCPYHPPAAYQPLREAGPLSHVTFYDGRKVWAVTGHPEARALLTDQRLSADRQNPAFPVPFERFAAIRRVRTPLIGVDDPEHNTQRRMLIPSFSVKRVAALRPDNCRAVPEVLTLYRRHTGQMSSHWRELRREWQQLLERMATCADGPSAAVRAAADSNMHRYFAWLATERGELRAAVALLAAGVRRAPGRALADPRNFLLGAAIAARRTLSCTAHEKVRRFVGRAARRLVE